MPAAPWSPASAPASAPLPGPLAQHRAAAPAPFCVTLCADTSHMLGRLERAVPRERLQQLLSEVLTQELGEHRRSTLLTLFLHRVAGESGVGETTAETPTAVGRPWR